MWSQHAKAWHPRTDVLGQLLVCLNVRLRSRRENGRNRIAGVGTNEQLVITGEAEVVPVLVKKSICNPWGGMEDVCRVVVTMYDPMSCEFSLPTKWIPPLF